MGPRTGPALAGVVLVAIPAVLLIAGVPGSGSAREDVPAGAGSAPAGAPEQAAGVSPPAPAAPAAPAATAATTAAPYAVTPRSLRIPSLHVNAPLERLRADRSGRLLTPVDPDRPGWYVDSVVPGELGPAVIAGHVDSRTGPAVFYRLASVKPGSPVEVRLSDGRAVPFRVVSVRSYAKAAFPTALVYGPTPDRALWLITCGGPYVKADGGYQNNVVVYALAA